MTKDAGERETCPACDSPSPKVRLLVQRPCTDAWHDAGESRCREGCHIPEPHAHTGVMVDSSYDEWWCPTSGRWEMCPGPCPDGSVHEPKRTVPTHSERVVLTSAPGTSGGSDG